jgi:hypothetical protein
MVAVFGDLDTVVILLDFVYREGCVEFAIPNDDFSNRRFKWPR